MQCSGQDWFLHSQKKHLLGLSLLQFSRENTVHLHRVPQVREKTLTEFHFESGKLEPYSQSKPVPFQTVSVCYWLKNNRRNDTIAMSPKIIEAAG